MNSEAAKYSPDHESEAALQKIARMITKAAFTVHRELGQGFLGEVYRNAMVVELLDKGLHVDVDYPVVVRYCDAAVGKYITDMIVEDSIIVEIKTGKKISKHDEAVLDNYLKATGINTGLYIGFGRSVTVKRKLYRGGRTVNFPVKST